MKILVLNCGSSSIKYQLFRMPEADVLARGLVQRIGEPMGQIDQQSPAGNFRLSEPVPDHGVGLKRVIEMMTEGDGAPLRSVDEIAAVGHRVVHGGERFTQTVLIDDEVIAAVEDNVELAPLHNPPNLLGIRVARSVMPHTPQVGVFDTAFHQTMPPRAYLYALPMSLYREGRIRRYGFHGTSHRYVSARAAEYMGRSVEHLKLITCHLGNGASIAAIENGQSIDTTMGLTPLEGLVMGTRSGDVDPGILLYLARSRGLSIDALDKLLNKQSGLLGLSGKSNDMRELEKLAADGDQDAGLALDVFCYRIRKYIGAYMAALGGLDALIFTGGIGENSSYIREHVCKGLDGLGVCLDVGLNATAPRGSECDVSAYGSRSRVLVVPTDEEKLIAMDTYALATASTK